MNGRREIDPTDGANGINRRDFMHSALGTAAAFAVAPSWSFLMEPAKEDVLAQIAPRHAQTVKMLRDWIALPSIAAENRGYPQGAEYMANLAREAGFQRVELVPTAGKPGVFATLDAGAKSWLGIYFMYDVKQYDPAEWSSPPLEGQIVDRPGVGKVMIGRGATNQKGPQVAMLAALHAFKAAREKLPVNLVLVCEGEEEIGSPNFSQVISRPEVDAALRKCLGVVLPMGGQDLDGAVQINLGAKGIVELELVSTGEKWGRGPKLDIHSSLAAQVDSPAWHL
ncbi:MAG TPA: M20/M25/M40 family metallo-hydrolase, partial [Gemmatimonadaceae bacterium]|nr:M20/M25/M40 family metallo-hydrolase [Gemmatimonadaceae bacterium]